METFDYDFYVHRNKLTALNKYGSRIDSERRVIGTDIWFDEFWRFHKDEHNKQANSCKMDKM